MKHQRFLQGLLTVLPVLTSGMYLLGLSYYQSYLSVFGIDDSVFPISNDRALFSGFFSLVITALSAASYAIAAILLFVGLVILSLVVSSTNSARTIGSKISQWLSSTFTHSLSKSTENILDTSAIIYGYTAFGVLALLAVVTMTNLAGESGRNQAEREISNFVAGNATATKLFSPQLSEPFLGKLVICGGVYCSLWSENGTLLIRHESIERMVAYPASLLNQQRNNPVKTK